MLAKTKHKGHFIFIFQRRISIICHSDIDDSIKCVAFKEQKPFNSSEFLSSIIDLKENMTVSFLLDTQLRWATIIACGQLWSLVKPLAGFLTLGRAGYTKQNFPRLSCKVVPILHRELCSFIGDYTFTVWGLQAIIMHFTGLHWAGFVVCNTLGPRCSQNNRP